MNKSTLPRIPQPFYSDLLARSFLRLGISRYESFRLAHDIWKKYSHSKVDHILLAKEVEKCLKEKYPYLVTPYRIWRKIMLKKKPIILFVGGGTGIGTSTIASRVAWLLEINRIVGTDSVREIIRQFLPSQILPLLNVSTYQTAPFVTHVKSFSDALIYGFISQSKKVLYGVEALVKRSIKENESIVIEGVHLLPEEMKFLEKYKKSATVVFVMLDVKQSDKHKQHFFSRSIQASGRGKEKYLKYFREIRILRDYLVGQAELYHVPVFQNYDMRKVEKDILERVYSSCVYKK